MFSKKRLRIGQDLLYFFGDWGLGVVERFNTEFRWHLRLTRVFPKVQKGI